MTDIFICYRRGDSAGHAGRLFDGIKERLGEAHVFMDVADLRPGQDFAFELERAVGRADCLLALIGPHWVDAVNASGQRRIDDPNDFVRREIVSGLAHCKTVIPVLVHGAQMPLAAQLPEPLQPLVRRQAFELRDQRWESDVGQLMQSLGLDSPGVPASHVPPSRTHAFPGWWWQFGVGLLALIGVAWMAAGAWWSGPALTPPVAKGAPDAAAPSQATDPPTTAIARAPLAAQPARQRQGFLVALPAVAEVRFRTNRAQVVVSILGIRQELRDSSTQVLTVQVRMFNRGPLDEAFGSDQFRLRVGDQSIAPTSWLNSHTEVTEAKDTVLQFIAPAGAADVALEVRVNADSTRIPIALSARSPIPDDASLDAFGRTKPARVVDTLRQFPTPLEAGAVVQVGKVSYTLSSAVIERETVEKASLSVTVRCAPPRGVVGTNFWSNTVRLWIDGVPRAPVNFVNLVVDAGDSKEAVFIFDFVSIPQTLEVGIQAGGDSVKIPLSLASLPRR